MDYCNLWKSWLQDFPILRVRIELPVKTQIDT